MPIRNEKEALQQALDLITALYEVNKNELKEPMINWLESESEIRAAADDEMFVPPQGKLYEGIFKASREPVDIGPGRLWNKAQKKLQEEVDKGEDSEKPVPIVHRRLLRLYWMVYFAAQDLVKYNPRMRLGKILLAQDLVKYNPRMRLGKILLDMEEDLRAAFVSSHEGITLPLAMLRKKQWDLLAKYGMGLTVDDIFDLQSTRRVIEFSPDKNLWVGIIIGVVIGFILAVVLLSS